MTKGQNMLKRQHSLDQVEKLTIDTALARNWTIPHRGIDVKVTGNNVALTGFVQTEHECNDAGKIAIQCRGVSSVNNKIVVIDNID